MEVKKLELIFLNSQDKKFTLGLNNPKDDLDPASLRSAMDEIIAANVFALNDFDLKKVEGARIIRKTIEEIL